MARPKKRERKRMSREKVANTSRNRDFGGGWVITAGDDAEIWQPKSECTTRIRILPYEVTKPGHPDKVEVGDIWYRRPYLVHRNVGGSGSPVLCPNSFNNPCPLCQEVQRLKDDDYDGNLKMIKSLKAQVCILYACVNVKDDEQILLFDWSAFKFSEKMEKEVNRGPQENLDFAQIEGGKVIKFRTVEATFESNSYFVTDRVDIEDAKHLTDLDDELLDRVPKLDECLLETSYDDIKAMFCGVTGGDEEEEEKPKATRSRKAKPAPLVEEDDPFGDEDEEDEEADEDACLACLGTKKDKRGRKCKVCNGTGLKAENEDEEEEEEEPPPPKKTRTRKAKPAPPVEDEEEDEDEEPPPPKKTKAKAKAKPLVEEDEEDEDEDWDDDDDEDW